MIKSETIAAIATGMTNSGIGIVRISGDDAFSIASLIFKTKSGKSLNEFESHRAYYGYIYDGEKLIDEVLMLVLKGPKSFTTEDTVEINCHGGLFVMNRILEVCIKNGCRHATKGEFTKRAFLGGRLDLSEAEAVIDIINSKNELSMMNSTSQLRGSLNEKIKNIRDILLEKTAFIEAALDDPEHYSLDGYLDRLKEDLYPIYNDINELENSFNSGKVVKEGINTCILGKPNVGKSSLMNILVGEERAIVTDIAGTTRDTLTENIVLDGISLNIADTAGIRETEDTVEKIGVTKAYEYADNSDFIIMVIDSSVSLNDEDYNILEYIKNKNAVVLLNKTDLDTVIDEGIISKYTDKKIIPISAKNETGINELSNYIKDSFLSGNINVNDSIIITNQRHKALLTEAKESINNVFDGIDLGVTEDLVTIDLVNAYECLGYIIGESISDDVINEVFSKFCMGK